MKIVFHSLLLGSSFVLVFLWEVSPLSDYTIQALALLVLLYILVAFIRRKINPSSQLFSNSGDIFMLTTSVLLLITVTGNLYSPLFFLLYFLGFGITFIFEPLTVFVFIAGTVFLFLPQVLKNESLESIIRVGSVALISPLAYFFGREYKELDMEEENIEKMKERAKDAADTIATDVEDVLKTEKATLKSEDVAKLNEILEETEELREEKEQK